MCDVVEIEEWKNVPESDGYYAVSNFGWIMSYRSKEPWILALIKQWSGHFRAPFQINKKTKYFTIHSLVLLMFVGPRPKGSIIKHLDGDK